MGKKNFEDIIDAAQRSQGGKLSAKISGFSHPYSPTGKFAGLIVYHKDGQHIWQQEATAATHNYRGRTFYVVIQDTSRWPPDREVRARGQGLVHDYILMRNIGINHSSEGNRVCCGGFAVIEGTVKYSSIWLNKTSGDCNGQRWESDGNKNMSSLERHIIDIVVREWKKHGVNRVIPLHKVNGEWKKAYPTSRRTLDTRPATAIATPAPSAPSAPPIAIARPVEAVPVQRSSRSRGGSARPTQRRTTQNDESVTFVVFSPAPPPRTPPRTQNNSSCVVM